MEIKIDLPDLTDWLQKAQRHGHEIPLVAATTAVNFYQQSFNSQGMYSKPRWAKRKNKADQGRNVLIGKGSGTLRRSIRQRHTRAGETTSIEVFTEQPHAQIHNEGGTYVPTPKQKKFFWAKHYETKEASTPKVGKRGKALKKTKRQETLSEESKMWLNLALAKTITMPQRQFMDIQAQGMNESLKRLIIIKVKKLVEE